MDASFLQDVSTHLQNMSQFQSHLQANALNNNYSFPMPNQQLPLNCGQGLHEFIQNCHCSFTFCSNRSISFPTWWLIWRKMTLEWQMTRVTRHFSMRLLGVASRHPGHWWEKTLISLKLQATMAGLLCLQLLAGLQKTRKLYGILPFIQLMLLVAVHSQALWLVNLLNH